MDAVSEGRVSKRPPAPSEETTSDRVPLWGFGSHVRGGQPLHPIYSFSYSGSLPHFSRAEDLALSGRDSVFTFGGSVIVAINEDGTVTCGSQRVIRWAEWDDYIPSSSWVMNNDPALFGGVQPASWGNNSSLASNASNQAEAMRTLFNRKLWPGASAMVVSESWLTEYAWGSSNESRHAAVLMRVRNSTSAAIALPLSLYFTSYGSWGTCASLAANGANTWSSCANNSGTTQVVTVSIPSNRVSTIVVVSASYFYISSSNFQVNNLALGFTNGSLAMPSGLSLVDDLDSLDPTTNIWLQ